MSKGLVFDIKEMAVHDGPGIRTTVFLKGCPLKCKWCHNPEGLIKKPQLMFKQARCEKCGACFEKCNHLECKPFDRCIYKCPNNCLSISGKEYTVEELCKQLKTYPEIMGDAFGGITFSGGEPLLQYEFLLLVIENLKGINLCIETSGFAHPDIFKKVISKLDFVIMDIKIADTDLHKKYTGVNNELILQNFDYLKKSGKPYLIRTPLIPNITDTTENIDKIKKIIGDSPWEKIPYNSVAGAKYKMLGLEYDL